MMRRCCALPWLALLLVLAPSAYAQTSTPAPLPQEPDVVPLARTDFPWAEAVRATWAGYKARYMDCGTPCGGSLDLVFDPALRYQATSESTGYGLLMAVMIGDQRTFNRLLHAAYTTQFNPDTGLMNWRTGADGITSGFGAATDGDLDAAAALVLAQRRVERREWRRNARYPYGERASALIDAIWRQLVVDGRYLKPGDLFGGEGREIVNPSYFAPAWFRLFDEHQRSGRWLRVIDQGYATLYANPGAPRGLAPDWSTHDGLPAYDYCDRNNRPRDLCRYDMFYDAIRVPWRVGLDCLWYGDPRACEWSARTAATLNRARPAAFATMLDLEGRPIVDYRDEAMVSMWLVAALAADDAALQARLERLLWNDYAQHATRADDALWGMEDGQFYYKQSLAWFAAALLSGDFRPIIGVGE